MPPLSYTGNEILLQTHFLRLMPHSSDFHWGVLGHVSRCTASETDDDQMEEATTDAMPDAILRGSGLLSSNSGLIQTQQREISRPPSPPPPVPHASVWIGPGGNHPAVRRSIMFGQYRTQTPQGKPLGVPYPHRSCPGTTHKPRQRVVPPQGGMNTAVHWK